MTTIVMRSLALAALVAPASCSDRSAEKQSNAQARIVLHTTAGDLVVALFPDVAPRTAKQFLRLASAGVFDTTYFYSVVPGFLAQTSWAYDRATPLSPEQRSLITKLPLEPSHLQHARGLLSMSRDAKDPNSAETSFCIMLGPAPQLDGKYTVFGRVESGLEVLSEIEKLGTKIPNRPRARVELTRAVVVSSRDEAQRLVAGAITAPGPAGGGSAAGDQAPSCHPAEQSQAGGAAAGMAMAGGAGAPAGSKSPVEIDDRVGDGGEQVRTVMFRNLFIDRIYPSMHGPWTQQGFKLAPSSQHVWLTGYRAEVMDPVTGRASQEFMCHTNLDLVGGPHAPPELRGTRAQLSISQGQTELRFPKGYALRVENDVHHQINLTAMVLNSNYPTLKKSFNFKSTIYYVDDDTAAAMNLLPLFQTSVYTVCPIEPPKDASDTTPACQPATSWEVHAGPYARKQTGHWIVPPGRQQFTHDVTAQLALPYDTTVHYIWMHLHPFGESMELRDKSTGELVWRGRAKNHPSKAMLLATDSYSSTKGILLQKDHEYELTTVYNNRSKKPVTAMAALWMYLRSRDERVAVRP